MKIRQQKKKAKGWLFFVKMFIAVLFGAGAFYGLYYAASPWLFKVKKSYEINVDVKHFYKDWDERQEQNPMMDMHYYGAAFGDEEYPLPYASLYNFITLYNARLYENKQQGLSSVESYEDEPLDLTEYGFENRTFGVLIVPKMDIEMPIFLGANYQSLADGVAVLGNTSIPIGGNNTNCVIAGHRGWNGYPYFRHIEYLEIGDEIYIKNLWEQLTYRVVDIQIVKPDNVQSILIQPGRDLVTLLTCHPPATGGKERYLVICERVNNW